MSCGNKWGINQAYPGEWWCLLIKPAGVIPSRPSFIQEWDQIHPKYELTSDIYPVRDASATWESRKELQLCVWESGITSWGHLSILFLLSPWRKIQEKVWDWLGGGSTSE